LTPGRRLTAPAAAEAVITSVILAVTCLLSYWVAATILAHIYSVARSDDVLGGAWAVIATIFVYRDSREHDRAAALSRMSATGVSLVLCLAYLLVLPPNVWGMALLIGLGALIVTLIGRPGDAITTGITTAVVIGIAAVNSQHAWQQPILRFFDTLIGVGVGLGAAWIGLRVTRALDDRRAKAGRNPGVG
jgi:uncharacterized membrane protein YccC